MFDLFAVTNRGLEEVCAAEISQLPGINVGRIAYRRVHARFSGDVRALLKLRTVDDLFLTLATWHGISPHRRALAEFESLTLDLDIWHAVNLRAEIADLGDEIAFSVSSNFVGRRNYTSDEIKQSIARALTNLTGWTYSEDDRAADVNLRIFIEHETALVGLRLADAPLGKRSYKQEHVPGSLKPPVAAALVNLAAAPSEATLLDPCCGAGTILVEAAALGLNARGGDQSATALAAARHNIAAANVNVPLETWDACALPIANASVDTVVTNLPWGRQVEVDNTLSDFYSQVCLEISRVTTPQGRIVILTNRADLVTLSQRTLARHINVSLFGQQPTILVFSPMQTSQ